MLHVLRYLLKTMVYYPADHAIDDSALLSFRIILGFHTLNPFKPHPCKKQKKHPKTPKWRFKGKAFIDYSLVIQTSIWYPLLYSLNPICWCGKHHRTTSLEMCFHIFLRVNRYIHRIYISHRLYIYIYIHPCPTISSWSPHLFIATKSRIQVAKRREASRSVASPRPRRPRWWSHRARW